jgi:hypothetical protein
MKSKKGKILFGAGIEVFFFSEKERKVSVQMPTVPILDPKCDILALEIRCILS